MGGDRGVGIKHAFFFRGGELIGWWIRLIGDYEFKFSMGADRLLVCGGGSACQFGGGGDFHGLPAGWWKGGVGDGYSSSVASSFVE